MDGTAVSASLSVESRGSVKLRTTASPCCRAIRSITALGVTGWRATGSPTAPHPARIAASRASNTRVSRPARHRPRNRAPAGWNGAGEAAEGIGGSRGLKDIAAQILILGDVGELFGDVDGVHLDVLFLQFRRLERNFVEHAFEDGMQ